MAPPDRCSWWDSPWPTSDPRRRCWTDGSSSTTRARSTGVVPGASKAPWLWISGSATPATPGVSLVVVVNGVVAATPRPPRDSPAHDRAAMSRRYHFRLARSARGRHLGSEGTAG